MVDSVRLPKSDPLHHNPAFHSWHGLGQDPSSSSPQHSGYFRRASTSRGSMRKMLPQTPDMDTQMSLSAKMIDRRTCTPRGNHSYGPFFLEYSLLAEYNLLQKQKMPGVYVIPSARSPLCWFGVIFVRQGIYHEGIFRFKLHIPENFPDGDCPRLFFDHPVFHPMVDPRSHELDLLRGFHKWKRNVNHIWQILLYARRIFYKIDARESANREAAQLYEGNPDAFRARAQACVAEWKSRRFDPPASQQDAEDPHYLTFSPFDPDTHGPIIKAMVEKGTPASKDSSQQRPSKNGISFMEADSLQIFSRNRLVTSSPS